MRCSFVRWSGYTYSPARHRRWKRLGVGTLITPRNKIVFYTSPDNRTIHFLSTLYLHSSSPGWPSYSSFPDVLIPSEIFNSKEFFCEESLPYFVFIGFSFYRAAKRLAAIADWKLDDFMGFEESESNFLDTTASGTRIIFKINSISFAEWRILFMLLSLVD